VDVVALITAPPVNDADSADTAAPNTKFCGLVSEPPSTDMVFGVPANAAENKNPVEPEDTTVAPTMVSRSAVIALSALNTDPVVVS
jgi:hypothetical protein